MAHSSQVDSILVTGATGKQGGATARALLSQGAKVCVLVRNPRSPRAQALRQLGATLVVGDLDDPLSLHGACAGRYGVFSVQNPDFANLESDTERVRARNLIEAARKAGVTHFVQTSTSGAGDHYRNHREWLAKHGQFNSLVSKSDIEDQVREAGFPCWTILKPSFFMENLFYILRGDRLITAYEPDRPVPMIAVEDIGAAAAAAFQDPEKFNRASIQLAGDLVTLPQAAKTLAAAWDRPIEAPPMQAAEVVQLGFMPAMVVGQQWHNEVGIPGRPEVARQWGLPTHNLETWADTHRPVDAAEIHSRILVLDAHVDVLLPSSLPGYFLPDGSTRTDLGKLLQGRVGALVLSIAAGPGSRDASGIQAARAEADQKLAAIRAFVAEHSNAVGLALTPDEVASLRAAGRIAVIMGFQNALSVGGDLSGLETFHRAGARVFALCHAGHNDFADSARPLGGPPAEHGGLSALGRRAVAWLNDRGALIDVAQLSKDALLQTVALSRAPVISSHANARALVDIARNLSDEELEAIAAHGGVVMLTPFAGYLTPLTEQQRIGIANVRERHGLARQFSYPADDINRLSKDQLGAFVDDMRAVVTFDTGLSEFIDHIDYVAERIGVEHVGIGTDFNHGAGIRGFDSAAQAPNVTSELLARGYSETQIAAIWGGNFLRAWRAAIRAGD